MTIKENKPDCSSVSRDPERDGYESGGLLYFRFEGKEMVAVIRDRSEFDKHRNAGTPLQSYCNNVVSDAAYGAALALEKLIPEQPV